MKTKIRRFSKSVLSVILAMTLIMSTMLIGTISVNASVTTLYVTGDAASGWGSWTQLSSKTDDKTIAYTTIKGNNNFKVSIAESYDQYNGISLDNSLGDVTISGSLGSGYLSTSNTNPNIYICVRLEDGHIYASTTKPSSGTTKTNQYYYKGTCKTVNSSTWTKTALTVSEDGFYEYAKCNSADCTTSGTNQFIIGTASDENAYKGQYVKASFNNTDITNFTAESGKDIYCYGTGEYYILVYYPNTDINTTTNPIICASTTLPNNSAPTTYTVTYGKVGSGTVTAMNGDTSIGDSPATVDANTTVTFTAEADTGYQFDGWYSDSNCSTQLADSSSTTYEVTVTENKNVYAKFTAINYTVTYGTGGTGSGSVTAKKDGTTDIGTSPASVAYNSSVTFTAEAASGSQFSGWYSDADCTNAISGATQSSTEYTATITANTTVYAKFTAIPVEFRLIGLSDTTFNYDNGIVFNEEGYVTVTVTADDISGNKHYFRIADGTNIYGSYGDSSKTSEIVSHTSSNKYGVNNTNEFNGTFNIGTPGTYKIYYEKQTGTGIDVWCEKVITTYTISKGTVDVAKGNFTISATSAAEGETVTVTPSPVTATDYSYAVDEVSYTTAGGTKTTVTATDGVYSFAMPADNVTVNVTFKKQYTITAGTCTGGSVGLGVGGTATTLTVDAADSGTVINVTAKADTNYEFVSWVDTDGVAFDTSNAITTATITKNATITATFKSTSTEPTENFYLEYWDGNNHQFIPYTSYADGVFTWETKFNFGNFSSDGKFRLTNTTTWSNGNESSFCVPAYKRSKQKGTETYVTVTAVGASVEIDSSKIDDGKGSYGVSEYNDIKLNGIDTSKTYIVTYKPVKSNSLDGQITIADKSVTPTLATPKIKGDSSALPGSTITVALDNQKDFGTDTDGDKLFVANDDSIKFAYTVTASDNSTVAFTESASGKITKADGTAINDSISFTASSDNGVTYTITCTVSSDGFADVTSSELTVKVGTIPYAQADRIYAYAKTLGAEETPAINAWVASETNASKLDTHNDSGDVKPTLGKTTDTDIRIFLPTTASSSKVVLYNSFSTSITVNGTEIQSGKYAEVSYTPNQEYTISNGKKLTIYKSTADGALYVNNTGDFASIDDNGALSMINKLYSDKEAGEIAAGNAGALADSNGVKDVAVKKIKGRGNSTWVSANKKSFNVTFTDNINAFGFTQGKKFSLLANFKDPSLSRNKILYELADLMGVKYSPDAATVDLYMNGLYMGSYLMCQKVDVGSKELVNDLGKTLLEDLYTDSASGKVPESAAETIKSSGFSFLMELDSNAGTGDFYTTVDTQKITIKEPEYLNDDGSIPTDAVTKAAQEFVQTKYAELNTAMSNTSITLEDLNKIIDVESLVKYYLINEIAKNYDIGVSSTYLVYNYTKGKFYISPLWDMDVTTGNCKVTDTNYQSYEGNWTDNTNEGTGNKFMALVFNNPQVQSAARKLWTGSYYTTLTNYIDTLTTKATSVEGSLNCNYTKWNYPYGFQGKYSDNVQALTSLNVATYNPSDNTYTVASSSTSYETTAVGQTQYVSDWLKSRVAWMSKKYNTYTIAGLTGWSGDSDKATMTYNGDGTHTYTFTSAADPTYGIKIYTDNGLSDDISAPQNSTHSCIWYDPDVQLIVDTTRGTLTATKGTHNNFGVTVTEASAEAPVYLIYNQKTNTLTLSDTQSTSSNPSVTLSGSAVASEDIKDGTAVTLTAKITPATSNNVVVTGDYTATLYIGDKVVTTKTVTFADDATEETTMNAVFSTYLEGTNQTYKVVVTCNDGEQDRKGTSNTVTYKQTGVKDQKIYFDPSTYTDSEANFVWLEKTTKDSTVTVTITDSSSKPLDTFKMYIDSDDIHGLDKGVFRGDISEETLAYFKDPSNKITFSMDDTSLTCSVSGQSDITSGWIYNYSSQTEDYQQRWEQYNVAYEESYPGGCTTYAEFKAYLAAQVENNTDNIVYFDNSASKFYNVYIYGWGETGPTKDAVLMKKLPYADIWYYDFESDNVTSNFLFKDRSSYGFGNNYQQTVDLVGNNDSIDHNQCVQNGDGDWVPLNFEATISTPNPIFITQNFYKVTEKNGTGTLKFRAFNTQWDEFAVVVASDVQTKAVDIYFDLHDDSATDIQLYHTSTNSKYTFASEFTRLTQMPGSTIYHSTIMLPYTDNGIAFKFDKFVVNYSGGKKTCAMSANVQPTFTCINTGEVWYEINSEFDNVGYDTAVSSASLLKANSPLLAAGSSDKVYFDNSTFKWTNVYVYFYSGAYYSSAKGTGSKTSAGSQGDGTAYTGTCMNASGEGYKMTDPDGDGIFEYSLDGFTGATCIAFTNTSQTGYEFFHGDGVQVVYRGDLATNISSGTTLYTPSNTLNATLNGAVKYYNEGTWSQAPTTTSSVFKSGTTIYFDFSRSAATSANILTTTYNPKDYAWHSDISADDIDDTKIIPIVLKADLDISQYSDRLYNINNQGDKGNSWIDKKNDTKILPTEGQNMVVINADGTYYWDTYGSSSPTPTISLSAASISLTLDNGTASTTLTTTTTNAGDATVTYTVDLPTGTVSDDGTTFTATAAGTYVVTASITVNGTTYPAPVTIIVSEEVTEDYCGVLAYNHSTATFDVTGGGKIDKTDVVLTNGYYTTGNVTTGYTSYDGTTYTVIYALPSTASSGATTSYSSTTSHPASDYKFNDWTKNGIVKSTDLALSDDISGTSTVAYVANWSRVKKVSYTFTYKYYEFDTSKGMAYAADRDTILNEGYVIKVTLPEGSSDDVIKAAYLANAPKLESDYYIYSFDGVDISISGLNASAIAKNDTIRYYTVRFDNGDTTTVKNYYYQHVAELSYDGTVPTGKYVAWMNENGEILHYGTTYKFRVTRNIDIQYAFVDSDSVSPATYVNEPTYEFYINNTGKEYVRFNILVENVLADLSIDNVEFGTLYFFTDSTGKPNDSTISVEADLDPNTLITVSDGKLNVKSGVGQHNVNTVSSEYKYIYAPKMPNTSANVDRYVRVYSYIAVKDDNGKYIDVIVSNSYALASIRDALNKS